MRIWNEFLFLVRNFFCCCHNNSIHREKFENNCGLQLRVLAKFNEINCNLNCAKLPLRWQYAMFSRSQNFKWIFFSPGKMFFHFGIYHRSIVRSAIATNEKHYYVVQTKLYEFFLRFFCSNRFAHVKHVQFISIERRIRRREMGNALEQHEIIDKPQLTIIIIFVPMRSFRRYGNDLRRHRAYRRQQ